MNHFGTKNYYLLFKDGKTNPPHSIMLSERWAKEDFQIWPEKFFRVCECGNPRLADIE